MMKDGSMRLGCTREVITILQYAAFFDYVAVNLKDNIEKLFKKLSKSEQNALESKSLVLVGIARFEFIQELVATNDSPDLVKNKKVFSNESTYAEVYKVYSLFCNSVMTFFIKIVYLYIRYSIFKLVVTHTFFEGIL